MKKIAICITTAALMALSALSKQSVSKVSAKVDSESLSVSYTLGENWDKNTDDECFGETCYYAYVVLFADKNDAATYFKDMTTTPVWEESLYDEYLGKGKHSLTFDLDGKEIWQTYPNAVAVVCVVDVCGVSYAEGRANVDFSAVSGASEEALRLYKKAQTLTACVWNVETRLCGMLSVKLGAINKKNGTLKVSATYTPFMGKKITASQTVAADDYGYLSGRLTFKGLGDSVDFEVYSDGDRLHFNAANNEYQMYSESFGGSFDKKELTFYMSLDLDSPSDDSDWVGAGPDGMTITVTQGTKWSLPKASSVKFEKVKEDGETRYELTGFDDENNSNPYGLKLTYTAKTGAFKGSFTLYSSNECCIDEGKAPSLKKYTGTISGIMFADGQGYGMAWVKVGKTTYKGAVWID